VGCNAQLALDVCMGVVCMQNKCQMVMNEKIITGNFSAKCQSRSSGDLSAGKYIGGWKLSSDLTAIGS